MEKKISFELRRLLAKGCRCSNCFWHKVEDTTEWDDSFGDPYVLRDAHVCKHKKSQYTPLINYPDKDCCLRWKEQLEKSK